MSTPSLQGKVALVTGATNGIGKVTALELARMGAEVVIVGRSRAKTEVVLAELRQQSGSPHLSSLVGDLSLMADVRRVAAEFSAGHSRLDILVNNAGAAYTERQMTKEGLELTFALNHMSYFVMTTLLLDLLKASAPARIISVSSDAHRMGGGTLKTDDLQSKKWGMGGFNAYSQTKLMNVMFTYALARRLAGTGVTANAVHPGAVKTGFGGNTTGVIGGVFKFIMRYLAPLTPEQGADTSIYLASSPEVEEVTGKYFDKRKAVQSAPGSYDEAAQEALWAASEAIARKSAPVGV